MNLHFPRVRIITPPRNKGGIDTRLTRVEVDGQVWPVWGYEVKSTAPRLLDVGRGVEQIQSVTLTFDANVTVGPEVGS